jgi:hypothetical protein
MRYVPLTDLARQLFSGPEGNRRKKGLFQSHKKLAQMTPERRQKYLRGAGPQRWTPIKNWLVSRLGNKCWYTEAELVGAPLAIDHFRPKCDYWWLAFEAENYRLSCPYANSPAHNPLYGCAGGKGDHFPLLDPAQRARGKNRQRRERPLLLDPCDPRDCDLIAFQADGRPVLNPLYTEDPVARRRLEESKILLNLDHPAFNTQREQLRLEIEDDIRTYEELAEGAASRKAIHARLQRRLGAEAPFSSAARYYLRAHRDLPWVEALLGRG